ncbi:MAG TPA: cohesin domain-containing protein [Parcubacteria group bacterium]|nr:cohesin domain-containing protein [Parcubacteria group bacterium]
MKKLKVLIVSLVLLVPVITFGAEVSLVSKDKEYVVNKEFTVNVYLDTEGDSINAVEGDISFKPSVLEVVAIKDGNSSVNFWINKPGLVTKDKISFSGVTPGGVRGQDRLLFSIVFKPIKSGESNVDIGDVVLLKNDGLGTKASTKVVGLSIKVVPSTGGPATNEVVIDDREPETFLPVIGRNSEIYEGKSFLVFSTQDKESGIEYYEVKEGIFGEYTRAISPFVLNNQKLDKKIYVKAVDLNGNTRVVSIKPENYKVWYKRSEILGIIILVILVVFYNRKKWFNPAEKL